MENIPIDRHDIEISYLTGVVDTMNLNLVEIKSLSSFYIQEGKKQKISPSSIDKYLWEVGNSFCNKKQCDDCPLQSLCNKKGSCL